MTKKRTRQQSFEGGGGKKSSWKRKAGKGLAAFLVFLVFGSFYHSRGDENKVDISAGGSWGECDVFAAPTKIEGGGWGMFAARSFEAGEIVEVAPLYLPMDMNVPAMVNSAVDDYYYGLSYKDYADPNHKKRFQGAPALGGIMIYNHHPEPNVRWWHFGRVPSKDQPDVAAANGFIAKRRIEIGEELFSNYGIEDGGRTWFKQRGLPMIARDPAETKLDGKELSDAIERYCPKIYSGPGVPTWNKVVSGETWVSGKRATERLRVKRMAPVDAAIGEVFATENITSGAIIETAPALVMPWKYAKESAFELLMFGWGDLAENHRERLATLRKQNYLVMQYQGHDTRFREGGITGSRRVERWTSLGDVALLSLGSIAMVKRVGGTGEESNCRIEIRPSQNLENFKENIIRGSAGILIELVATRDIRVGEVMKLDIAPAGTLTSRQMLLNELKRMGQPIPEPSRLNSQSNGAFEL